MEEVTTLNLDQIDGLMKWFEDSARNNLPVDPGIWVTKAMELNALKGNIDDAIADLEHVLAKRKVEFLVMTTKANIATAKVEAEDNFHRLAILKAKEKRIVNFIQLAKKQAEIRPY